MSYYQIIPFLIWKNALYWPCSFCCCSNPFIICNSSLHRLFSSLIPTCCIPICPPSFCICFASVFCSNEFVPPIAKLVITEINKLNEVSLLSLRFGIMFNSTQENKLKINILTRMSVVALREWRLAESATSCRQIRFQIIRLLKPRKIWRIK